LYPAPPPLAKPALLQYDCTTVAQCTPSHPLGYAIHDTILVMAISCEGLRAPHTGALRYSVSNPGSLRYSFARNRRGPLRAQPAERKCGEARPGTDQHQLNRAPLRYSILNPGSLRYSLFRNRGVQLRAQPAKRRCDEARAGTDQGGPVRAPLRYSIPNRGSPAVFFC